MSKCLTDRILDKIPIKEEFENINGYGNLDEKHISSIQNIFRNELNIIQGLPGTGKTLLFSFKIYNIFKYGVNKEGKILIVVPTNTMADNLAIDLLKINKALKGKMKLLRVFAMILIKKPEEEKVLNLWEVKSMIFQYYQYFLH